MSKSIEDLRLSIIVMKHSIYEIEEFAADLRYAHTLDGEWDKEDYDAEEQYLHLMGVAEELRSCVKKLRVILLINSCGAQKQEQTNV